MAKIDLLNNPLYQSPHTYLQAAGSDGTDGTARGLHLRWALRKFLGDHHLPKGDYAEAGIGNPYQTAIGFNRDNDFVKIYRTAYRKTDVKIKFKNDILPVQEINTGTTREWHYTGLLSNPSDTGNITDVYVKFTNVAEYDTIRATMTTLLPEDFIKQYTSVIEVSSNKLMFAYEFKVNYVIKALVLKKDGGGATPAIQTGKLRVESISLDDISLPNEPHISCRKVFNGNNNNNPFRMVCENIPYFRFDRDNTYPTEISIETYEDFIRFNNRGEQGSWDFVGDFSLTVDDTTAHTRLESATYPIDKKWPKFNEYDQTSGAFTVKVSNYQDKWNPSIDPLNGLKQGVITYLTESVDDLKANVTLDSEEADDNAQFTMSSLDMLKLVSLDFHVARILGLGHIDTPQSGQNQQYVYCMQYYTSANLENGGAGGILTTHTYLTLPTGRRDFRLPPPPTLKPVSYGLYAPNATSEPTLLTTPEGYSLYSDVRFININRDSFNYEKPFGTFFYEPTEYCLCDESLPVLFGLEYREDSESAYRKPEISNDPSYIDYASFPEVVPIPDTAENPIYIHQETEEGIHHYAMYSINWFSRISPLGNEEPTNDTNFPKRNTLLPPFNFAVQLIQDEDPNIFTTTIEQTMLANYTALDKTLVRTTFEWNHIHNNAYQAADKAEFFFREENVIETKGKITAVIPIAGTNTALINTGPYTVTSVSPAQIVQPNINPIDVNKFIGSSFSANEKNYVIDQVNSSGSGDNPSFIVRQIKQTQSSDPLGTNQFITTESFISPVVGEMFITGENLSDENNWKSNLIRRVYLEKFFTNHEIKIENSTFNNKFYAIDKVEFTGGNTDIYVSSGIKNNTADGDLIYNRIFKIAQIDQTSNSFVLAGNVTSEFTGISELKITASKSNEGNYAINNVSLVGSDTWIEVNDPIPDAVNFQGYLNIKKITPVTAVDITMKKFTVAGNLSAEIIPPLVEYITETNGSQTRTVPGGIYGKASVIDIFEDSPPFASGTPTGAYTIKFDTFVLEKHIDPEVEFYKGSIRISDSNPNIAERIIKTLQVWDIKRDSGGNYLSPLELTVYDPNHITDTATGNFPILTDGSPNIDVNFHPGYRLYLKADTNTNPISGNPNNFDSTTILPAIGEGNRKTLMAVRSIDTTQLPDECESFISVPVVLLAQEIVEPMPPGPPTGPLFATRPDFYGKSTYTFDVKVDTTGGRVPHSFVFYRANEDKILDTLYKPETVAQIKTDLTALTGPDAAFFNDRWFDLLNGNYDGLTGLFNEHTPGGYRFPIPDNNNYRIPDRRLTVIEKPFDGILKPGDSYNYTTITAPPRPMIDIIIEALNLTFLPLTEQPLMYKFIKNGTTTSNKKPVFRKANGELLPSTDPAFDFSPMCVKYLDGADTFLRFTDYTLDGSSKNIYFYYGIEMTNKAQFGPRSAIVGPIQLVHTNPAEAPEIKRVLTQLQNTLTSIPTAVRFELNNYIPGENIKKLQIYRTSDVNDALTVRNMKLVKTVDVGTDVLDDFSDVAFPLYGDPLFYRLAALREITNEFNQTEYVPSKPSDIVMASIVDNVNPPAPQISFTSDPPTTTSPITLNNVTLNWPSTCYNGTYYLYKMTSSGNWMKIYQVKSNDPIISVNLVDTDLANGSIVKQDEDLNTIYTRFRVQVENSSGLLNLTQKELTI
jgi:hypothetical protein